MTIFEPCRVYWGSHGCDLPRGHDSEIPHLCLSCLPAIGESLDGYVGVPPYYGPETQFYGKDVALVAHSNDG